jgi:hypothetical protein
MRAKAKEKLLDSSFERKRRKIGKTHKYLKMLLIESSFLSIPFVSY